MVINSTIVEIPQSLLVELGRIGLFLQAIGAVILIWIVFEIFSLIINRRKEKLLYGMKEDIKRLERKINKLKK